MTKRLAICILCLFLFTIPLVPINKGICGPNLREGLWEITSQMQMKGMQLPAHTSTQCIKKDQPVPQSAPPDQQCKMKEYQVRGDVVTWTMECSGAEGQITAKGKITYMGDTFQGTVRMTMEGQEMINNMKGRRVGDCP